METELYRCFDAGGRLVYVGISIHTPNRLHNHIASDWFSTVTRIEIERHPSREAAEAAETAAVKNEKPIANKSKRGTIIAVSLSDEQYNDLRRVWDCGVFKTKAVVCYARRCFGLEIEHHHLRAEFGRPTRAAALNDVEQDRVVRLVA